MNRIQQTLFDWLEDCAERNLPCPRNQEIQDHFNFGSAVSASHLIAELEEMGLITVVRGANRRNVTIVSTGKETADRWVSPSAPKITESERKRQQIPTPRRFTAIDRTPCRRCGVRADIGCSHVARSEAWEVMA